MNQTPALFANSPAQDTFHLLKKSGQVDGKKISEALGFKPADLAAAANISQKLVRLDSKMPAALKERMLEWGTAINLVGIFFKDFQTTMIWFQTPNPLLGNTKPRDMIRLGRYNKLLKFIQTALAENNHK